MAFHYRILVTVACMLAVACSSDGAGISSDQTPGTDVVVDSHQTDTVEAGFDDATADVRDLGWTTDDGTATDEGPGDTGLFDQGPETELPTTCKGETGCPCAGNEECFSGLCVETMAGWVCSSFCVNDDSCPDRWNCLVVGGSGSDVLFGCVDPFARLCQPCIDDAECVPAVAASGKYACISHGPDGSYCGVECDDSHGCPDGFTCEYVQDDRVPVRQCVPADGAACSCTAKYQDQGNLTDCWVENEFGTCLGQRTCDQDCDAAEPTAEACNGLDDDCDGVTDEDIEATQCPLENQYGTCMGHIVCDGGLEKCDGTFAAPEVCNGLDEDCDGETDEAYPDSDGDGLADCVDPDIDGDLVLNDKDNCVDIYNPDQTDCDGDGEGAACEADDDNDWVPDVTDNCLCLANPDQTNTDGDELGDACDCDIDNDGVANANTGCPTPDPADNCVLEPNAGQEDLDGDGLGDACDPDRDNDGVLNGDDNCPDDPNADQADNEKDLLGDVCDPDDDNDLVPDGLDNCAIVYNPDQGDLDGDGLGDVCDPDKDDDGVLNGDDNCPATPNPDQADLNHNDVGDACEADWDGDGVPNTDDNCPWAPNQTQADLDGDLQGDACDCDIDGDGVMNANQGCGDPDPEDNCVDLKNPGQENLDGDSLGDACDPDRDGDGDPNETDCAPDHPGIHHDQKETCNGYDDNCDGVIDEDGASGCDIYFYDGDSDGYGIEDNRCICAKDGFYTAGQKGDCDDADGDVNPGEVETCDGKDNDCSGGTDEEGAEGCTVYYRDFDVDGFGLDADSMCLCSPQQPYVAVQGGDCNDLDPTSKPDAVEKCSSKDDDCDGQTDEEDAQGCQTFFFDGDQDTYGTSDDSKCLCGQLGKYSADVGGDCDDQNVVVHPDAVEQCPNGIDEDCDGATDEEGCQGCTQYYLDVDDDGFGLDGDTLCLSGPTGDYKADNGDDCNDSDGEVYPGADEACNGYDDDCDGATDEKDSLGCVEYFLDYDGDSFGVTGNTKCLCEPSGKYTALTGGDCRDTDSAAYPDAAEVCNNKDDDCDGATDESGAIGCDVYYFDNDGDSFGVAWNHSCLCAAGDKYTTKVSGDCDDNDGSVNPGASEACNSKDDDCDDVTDEEDATGCETWYFDDDGDTYGVSGLSRCLCGADGKYAAEQGGDCNDSDDAVHPGALETCNEKDDDCDGATDSEDAAGCVTFYRDGDSDNYGVTGDTKCLCAASGLYTAGVGGDCVDDAPEVHPSAPEVCGNSIDDDCDALTDEPGCSGCITFYMDNDQDSWGVAGDSQCLSQATGKYTALNTGDCNDNDANIHPQATESCNGWDDDCDDATDEEGASGCSWYFHDGDDDGWGITGDKKCLCSTAGLYTATKSGDCDDTSSAIHPTAIESCNGWDDDCNGTADDEGASGCVQFHYDYDQDGYGIDDIKCYCEATGKYSAAGGGDCDDASNQIFPGANEVCNNLDDDCDGAVDEEGATGCMQYYRDYDGDGEGSTQWKCLCKPSGDYDVTNSKDCCDSDSLVKTTQTGYFALPNACGNYDYNCVNGNEKEKTDSGGGCTDWSIGGGCNVDSGWAGATPDCGQSKQYITGGCGYCCFLWTCCCDPSGLTQTQRCR